MYAYYSMETNLWPTSIYAHSGVVFRKVNPGVSHKSGYVGGVRWMTCPGGLCDIFVDPVLKWFCYIPGEGITSSNTNTGPA